MMTCTVAENMKMPAVAENRMISPSPSHIEMLQRVIRNNSRKIILFALTSDEVRGGKYAGDKEEKHKFILPARKAMGEQ